MLCLSKYRVRVCPMEIFSESILKILCRKSQQKTATENCNRKPLPIETMGRGDLWSGWVCREYTNTAGVAINIPSDVYHTPLG